MSTTTRSYVRSTPSPAPAPEAAPVNRVDTLLQAGLRAWEEGDVAQALTLMRKAACADLRRPEAWYWMGRVHEEAQDRAAAGYCFYFANDIQRYAPALDALRRLGYLGQDQPSEAQAGL